MGRVRVGVRVEVRVGVRVGIRVGVRIGVGVLGGCGEGHLFCISDTSFACA